MFNVLPRGIMKPAILESTCKFVSTLWMACGKDAPLEPIYTYE